MHRHADHAALLARLRGAALTLVGAGGQPALGFLPESVLAALESATTLVGVPLSYLFPDPTLLPTESVQLFVVDPAWVRALQRGLLGAGSPERLDDAELDAVLDQASPLPAEPLCGLLFASTLLRDHPGVVVRAWAGDIPAGGDPEDPASGAVPVGLTRHQLLTPSILVAIFTATPSVVTIEEPHGSIRLGVRRDGAGAPVVGLRDATGALVRIGGAEVDVAVPFRGNPDAGVVDVVALATALQARAAAVPAATRPPDPSASPAGLGLQLLLPPARQRYQRGAP
jgi:hypothetical protein